MVKKVSFIVVFILLSLSLSACFGPKDTQEDQAIVITKSGKIQEVKFGGGRHVSLQPYIEGTIIGLGIREATFITDGNVAEGGNGRAWTKDSQPVIISMALEYRVIPTDENILYLWQNKKSMIESDDAKAEAVRTRFLSEVKDVSTEFTLLDIVGVSGVEGETVSGNVGRDQFVQRVTEELAPEMTATGLELVSLRLVNIDPADDEYEALLNEAAKSKAREKAANDSIKVKEAEQRAKAIDNQISIDYANTQASIRQIDAQVWQDDRAYQIELTRLMSQALSAGDLIIFVPEGEDLTYILNGATGNVIPVEENLTIP